VNTSTAIALPLALASTVLINFAYLREHDAVAALPVLSMRRPLQSARALLTDRSWLLGFAMESVGFLLYVAALRLASLALVQSVAAGGIGVLAYVSSRFAGRRLSPRERNGVLLSVLGLAALGVSLIGGSGQGGAGSTAAILVWLGATAGAAVFVVTLGRRMLGVAVAEGVAGGLFFSLGDVSTKVATQGGARIAFVIPLILGYTLGTWLLQLGYQRVGDAPDECGADRCRHDRARRAGSVRCLRRLAHHRVRRGDDRRNLPCASREEGVAQRRRRRRPNG
jgi:hypothetical protein